MNKIKSFFKSLFSKKQVVVNVTINLDSNGLITELQRQSLINEKIK